LSNWFFYGLTLIAGCYTLAYAWYPLIYVAHLIGFTLISLTVFDFVRLNKFAPKVSASRILPQHFSMSDENTVIISLDNDSKASLKVRLIDELPVQLQQRNFQRLIVLGPFSSERIKYSIQPMCRGAYEFGYINLFLSTNLRLLSYRKKTGQNQTVKVYPSFVQMKKYELMAFAASSTLTGIKKTKRVGHGYEYSDIRSYVLGDDLRTLNWKASGRTGKLMVNNYEDEKSQPVYAIINRSRVMRMPFNGLSLTDYAINASLALLNLALKNKDLAGLITFANQMDTYLPASKRSNQLQLLRNALYNEKESQLEENYKALFEAVHQKIKRRSLLLLFTNFMTLSALNRALPQLKRLNSNHLLVVIFFENTELTQFGKTEVKSTLDIASTTMARKLSSEQNQVVYELRNAGIQTIKTAPENLTSKVINQYLELKSQGLI
jgi:uncharacterized protein (DUF58 family)